MLNRNLLSLTNRKIISCVFFYVKEGMIEVLFCVYLCINPRQELIAYSVFVKHSRTGVWRAAEIMVARSRHEWNSSVSKKTKDNLNKNSSTAPLTKTFLSFKKMRINLWPYFAWNNLPYLILLIVFSPNFTNQ